MSVQHYPTQQHMANYWPTTASTRTFVNFYAEFIATADNHHGNLPSVGHRVAAVLQRAYHTHRRRFARFRRGLCAEVDFDAVGFEL